MIGFRFNLLATLYLIVKETNSCYSSVNCYLNKNSFHYKFVRYKLKAGLRQHVCNTFHAKLLGTFILCRSQWPRDIRRGSSAARLLRLPVRMQPGAWMSVSCECCVLPRRGLCIGPTASPEESYGMWRV